MIKIKLDGVTRICSLHDFKSKYKSKGYKIVKDLDKEDKKEDSKEKVEEEKSEEVEVEEVEEEKEAKKELEDLKKEALIDICKEKEIPYYGTKEEIIERIRE